MQSRRKWKLRYYRERKRRKEADKAIGQLYSDYNDAGNKMFEYAEQVEQLETREKELIKNLEDCTISYYTLNEDGEYVRNNDVEEFAQEILNLLKGEKE